MSDDEQRERARMRHAERWPGVEHVVCPDCLRWVAVSGKARRVRWHKAADGHRCKGTSYAPVPTVKMPVSP